MCVCVCVIGGYDTTQKVIPFLLVMLTLNPWNLNLCCPLAAAVGRPIQVITENGISGSNTDLKYRL